MADAATAAAASSAAATKEGDAQPAVVKDELHVKTEVKDEKPSAPLMEDEAEPSTSTKAEDTGPPATGGSAGPIDESLLKDFFSELKGVDRDNEVNRILWAFKLNPYEKLNLRFDATVEDVRRQYRKVSLMVHPDKCSHPQASAAFEVLKEAQKELLDDERRENLLVALNIARDDVRKERQKATKNDAAIALAAVLHERGREGVEEEYEKSDEFHEKWKMKARDILASTEWRRRRLTKRLKDETARVEAEEQEDRERMKKARAHNKEWESTRDTRVGTWRDFMKTKSKKKPAGELKPPKLKTNDEDKLYVQRPVGEQFRPPPPKGGISKGKKGKK